MIKNVPKSIIEALDATCGGIVCAEVYCGDYDREEVWKYLVEMTNIGGNEDLKKFIIEQWNGCVAYWDSYVGNSEIDGEEFEKMLAGGKLEDTTLSFDFEKMLDMKYTNTEKGIFITTNNGRINDSWDYGEIIAPAYDMLKKKFPGIKYYGLDCYVWTCEHCGEPFFVVYGDGKFKSKEVERYLKSKISEIDFDECSCCFYEEQDAQEAMDFLIKNGLYKEVEKYINMLLKNNDCEEYLSSEEFDDAIHTLCEKKHLSYKLSMEMLDHDKLSIPVKAEIMEYVHNSAKLK